MQLRKKDGLLELLETNGGAKIYTFLRLYALWKH